MKGKRLKQLLLGIAVTILTLSSNGLFAYASEITVTGDTYSGSFESNFVIDDSVLGGDLIVSVPAEMVLSYDSSSDTFTKSDVVTAKGGIVSSKRLEITVPTTVVYSNKKSDVVNVDGSVTFGTNGVDKWMADELRSSTIPVERDISVSVDKNDISYTGTYSTTINYTISVVDNN